MAVESSCSYIRIFPLFTFQSVVVISSEIFSPMILICIFQKDLKLLISETAFAFLKVIFSFHEPLCYIYNEQKNMFFNGNNQE